MPLVHELMIVNADVRAAPRDETAVNIWLKNLVKDLGMNILMGPYTKYSHKEGNRGLTTVVIIDTSHIAMHCWDECNPHQIKLHVYSCAPVDPQVVLNALQCFGPTHVDYKMLDLDGQHITLLENSS